MLRFVILSVLFICGVLFGFCYFINYFPLEERKKKVKSNFSYMGISSSKDKIQVRLNKTRIPFFKNGTLKTEITAKELIWRANKPVFMKLVRVKEYSEDGTQIIARMTGDFGEIYLSNDNDFERLKIWGNTKVIRYNLKKEELK